MADHQEPPGPPTLVVVTFVLALLGLILGFHNVSQRGTANAKLDAVARTHARANADARLTALEAERDALREQLQAIETRVEALETPVAEAP